MKRFLMLVALGSIGLCSTTAFSQSRDLGARRLILDDGGTGRLTIEYAGPGSGTFTFPDGNSTTVAPGTVSWQTLYWNGLQWVASSALSTDGNDVAITATNTTINSVNGTDVIGDLRISAAGSSTADPAIFGVTPWAGGNAARWEFGDAANAISSSFGGRMQMVSWWGLEIYGAAGFGAPVPSFPVGTPGDDAVTIHTVKTGTKGLTVNGVTGQTADLQNWKVNNVEVARVTASGAIDATSLTLDNALTIAEGGTGVDATSTAANLVFASPAAGAGAPSFRALAGADLPAGSNSYINNGTTAQTADFNITGDGVIGDDLTVGGAIALTTTSATDGQITLGGSRFMHAYGNGATFVGTTAGNFTQTGAENTGVGLNALRSIAAGNHNTAVGANALVSNTTGVQNTAIGRNALASVVSTGLNTAVGTAALMANTSIQNTAVGNAAAMQTSTGFNNVAVGNSALLTNVTGSNNTAIGASANVSTSNLSNATAIGANATVTASNQIMLGSGAVTSVTTSGAINTDAGFRVANAAPAGQYLRGNGTNFIAGAIQAADLPAGSGSYINNGTTPQAADFNITGNGTIGDGADNISLNAGTGSFSLASNGLDIGTAGDISNATSVTFKSDALSRLITVGAPSSPGQGTSIEIVAGVANGVSSPGSASLQGGASNTQVGGSAMVLGGSSNTNYGGGAQLTGGFSTSGTGGTAYVSGGYSSSGPGGTAIVEGGSTGSGLGGNIYIQAGSGPLGKGSVNIPATVIMGDGTTALMLNTANIDINSSGAISGVTTIDANSARISGLNVAAGTDKFAGIITTDDANGDNTETYSNSLITANSIVVVSPTSYLGMGVGILYATPSAGTLTITFNVNVSDGKQISYIIVNP